MILLQMAGHPGSGKSTISKEIANKINAVVIDKDILKSSMLDQGLNEATASKLAYKMMFDLVKFYLEQGRSVVIDSPCYYEEIIEQGLNLAEKYHACYKYLECYVKAFGVIESRINDRDNMSSQTGEPSLKGFDRANLRAQQIRPSCSMVIKTDHFEHVDYDQILKYLNDSHDK